MFGICQDAAGFAALMEACGTCNQPKAGGRVEEVVGAGAKPLWLARKAHMD